MKNTKIALATVSALLITTAFSNAQTTVGGNMRIGIKGSASDDSLGSNSRMVKETQINIANKGKLNIGGLEYAAGFSVEFDGNDLNRAKGDSSTVCTAHGAATTGTVCTTGSVVNGSAVSFGKAHYENNYIDIINPSTKTTISFSADHLKPSDVQLSDIVGGPASVDHVMNHTASVAGASKASKYTDKMDDKGSVEGFGIGFIQDLGIGKLNFIYQPDASENFSALGDTGGSMTDALSSTSNSFKDISFRGDLGVKGLDVLVSRNVQEGTGAERDIKFHSEGVRYTMGAITGAYQQSKGDYSTTATAKSKEYGLAYTVTPTLSVGAVLIKTKDDAAVGIDEKITGLSIGYNLGPVFLSTVVGKIDDAGNTAGADAKAIQISLGTTF